MLKIQNSWYRESLNPVTFILLPLSWLFGALASVRHWLYRIKFLHSYRFNTPVVIIGNISVGGTGKTSLVMGLAQFLKDQGYNPGIVTRGVGGKIGHRPYFVRPNDACKKVGDEGLMLAKNTACPVIICRNRAKAVEHLLRHSHCNVVLSDDGLQHYQLRRDLEIAVVDGMRLFGNRKLLPAGPLREKISRLDAADFVILNQKESVADYHFHLKPIALKSVSHYEIKTASLDEFRGKKIHAVAGIGNPKRFFDLLTAEGFEIIPHVFKDHHHFSPQDIQFKDDLPIVMTEKDAVKCKDFANPNCWYLKVAPIINEKFLQDFLKTLKTAEVFHDKKIYSYTNCDIIGCYEHDY